MKKIIFPGLTIAVLIVVFFTPFSSRLPDGLECVLGEHCGTPPPLWLRLAGLALVCALAVGLGFLLRKKRK